MSLRRVRLQRPKLAPHPTALGRYLELAWAGFRGGGHYCVRSRDGLRGSREGARASTERFPHQRDCGTGPPESML